VVFFAKRIRKQYRRLVIILLLITNIASLYSQETGDSSGDEKKITIEISPDKIIAGQRFDLTIFADYSSYRDVQVLPPQFPPGLSLVSGPYKSAHTIRVGDASESEYIKNTRI